MASDERKSVRETSFSEQVQTVLAVERQLAGRWVIQKFAYGEWRALWLNPIMPGNPLSEMWAPFSGVQSYATSGEAVDAMMELQSIGPGRPMRVVPAEEDIKATPLIPRTGREQAFYGRCPRWGELLLKFNF